MFGYINALKKVGVRSVQFVVTTHVTKPTRFVHKPTDSIICALPASKPYLAYRKMRRRALKAYGGEEGQPFKEIQDTNQQRRALLTQLKDIARSVGTYLATPLGTLARELRREGCTAILCQEYESPRFDTCVLLGRLLGLPVFASFQGGNETRSLIEYVSRSAAFRACTGVIIAPQTEIRRVRTRYQLPPAKIARIFNTVDTVTLHAIDRAQARAKLNIPPEACVVVCHGRIDLHRKGLDILLDAWDQICRDRPHRDLRLLLVGSGPDADKLRQRIETMNLRGVMWRNQFVNDRAEICCYLSAADVYTLASRQEGFPVAPLEAMACGIPVVAADAPGVPDILEEGEKSGGIVVPRGDSKALATELGRVLDDIPWARELGKRARLRIEEHFSPEVIGQQLRDFIVN
ncbi:glycosyltransferase family 4 protein [Kovacikia minuta CCNUW1]|uniref:glycosyltransferase family 4 protein n=1 Tax=Kovacikia minuta TaxID=2931930 RepID=UPI001CCFCC5A|nr:glycosyltransferase family 4 protein [Kovacikia minuta]UBF24130.1 glycosyltransferase family 4 protein [Kovacikia minuta CCNUW1]